MVAGYALWERGYGREDCAFGHGDGYVSMKLEACVRLANMEGWVKCKVVECCPSAGIVQLVGCRSRPCVAWIGTVAKRISKALQAVNVAVVNIAAD